MISTTQIKPVVARIGAELRANSRLRWGAWIIIGILWFYGVLLFKDVSQAQLRSIEATAKEIARAQVLASQNDWASRLRGARDLQQSLESRLWRAGTLGLAQAGFQDWMNQTVQQMGLRRPVIAVAAQEEALAGARGATPSNAPADSGAPELWKASARIGFDFEPNTLYRFLERLATYEKAIGVESLTIRGAPSPRVEMVVVASFQKPAVQRQGSTAGEAKPPGS